MGPDLDLLAEAIGPELKSKPQKREMLPREEAPSDRERRRQVDSRAEDGHANDLGHARGSDPHASAPRPSEGAAKKASAGRENPTGKSDLRRDERGVDHDLRDSGPSSARSGNLAAAARREPPTKSHRAPSRPTQENLALRAREEAWSAGAYDEPEDTPAALMLIEARAASRLRSGDLRGAIALLRRAISLVRGDVDRGDIDDPIGAMAMFTGKLGDALMSAGEHQEALATLSESLHLTVTGSERIRLLLQMSRAARSSGRDPEATRYLEDAEREARTLERRRSDHPATGDGGRDSGVTFNRDSRSPKDSGRPSAATSPRATGRRNRPSD